jgi:hypothetical protein
VPRTKQPRHLVEVESMHQQRSSNAHTTSFQQKGATSRLYQQDHCHVHNLHMDRHTARCAQSDIAFCAPLEHPNRSNLRPTLPLSKPTTRGHLVEKPTMRSHSLTVSLTGAQPAANACCNTPTTVRVGVTQAACTTSHGISTTSSAICQSACQAVGSTPGVEHP